MISDTERREVARRLRELAKDADEVSYFDLARTLGLGAVSRYGYDPDDVERLADLIEPPTQCPYYHSDRHHCSAYDDVVDRDALLALADEIENNDVSYCVSAQYVLDSYADRIREALGVEC